MTSPHLRGKFAELLYFSFLPLSEREGEGLAASDQCVSMLRTHPLGCQYLSPSLLELFGDVEKTGEYDRIHLRLHITRWVARGSWS